MLPHVLAAAIGYLLGAFPTASLAARLKGIDVFGLGSGNMGAMNAVRNLGPALGVGVLLVDVAKGAAAVVIGQRLGALAGAAGADAFELGLSSGVFAVAGHCFSVFVAFRGGKGLASLFGVSLPYYPLAGLAGAALLAALYLATRRVRWAVTAALLGYPPTVIVVLHLTGWERERTAAVLVATAAASLIAFGKHLLAWRRESSARPSRAAGPAQ